MATAGISYDELQAQLQATPAPVDTKSTSESRRETSKPNMDALTSIVSEVNTVMQAEKVKQTSAENIERELTTGQVGTLTGAAVQQLTAAEAAGRQVELKTEATRAAQEENIALRQAADIDPKDANSALIASIRMINEYSDEATLNIVKAKEARDTTLGSVIRGERKFSDWMSTKFVRGEKEYTEAAKSDLAVVATQADRLNKIQAVYSNQVAINTVAQSALNASSAADARIMATQQLALQATALQKEAFVTGAAYIKDMVQNSNTRISQSISAGTLKDKVENSKRSWEAFAAKSDDNLTSYAALVNTGRQFLTLPELTPQQIKALKDTPANKAMLDTFGFTGSILRGSAVDPSSGIPNALGSPGETAVLLLNSKGTLPQGMERIQDKIMSIKDSMPMGITGGKPASNAQIAEYVNNGMNNYIKGIHDVDADPIFGQVNTRDLLGLKVARLQTPETQSFVSRVLTPITAGNANVPLAMIVDATFADKELTTPEKVAGLVAYAKAARDYVAATRRNSLVGVEAPSRYSTRVFTGSLFGTKTTVDFTSEKEVNTYLFKRENMERAKRKSMTLPGAVAETLLR